MRVIAEDGSQLGIMPLAQAISLANGKGLDLVLISPKANPPVCKVMDYGKYKYMASKKASQARKRQQTIQVKEIKLRASTDAHDLEVKLKQARKFLEAGNKVKLSLRFRGREMMYAERGLMQLQNVADQISEYGKVEVQPKLEGMQMIMVIAPLKK